MLYCKSLFILLQTLVFRLTKAAAFVGARVAEKIDYRQNGFGESVMSKAAGVELTNAPTDRPTCCLAFPRARHDSNLSGFTIILSCCCCCWVAWLPERHRFVLELHASDVRLISFIFYFASSLTMHSPACRTRRRPQHSSFTRIFRALS